MDRERGEGRRKRATQFRISIIQNNFILLLKLGQDSGNATKHSLT